MSHIVHVENAASEEDQWPVLSAMGLRAVSLAGTPFWGSGKGGANCRAPLGLWDLDDGGPKAALVALRLPWAGLSLPLWCACSPPLSRKWMGVFQRGFRQSSCATEGLLWRKRVRFQRKWGLSRAKWYPYRARWYGYSESWDEYRAPWYRYSAKWDESRASRDVPRS